MPNPEESARSSSPIDTIETPSVSLPAPSSPGPSPSQSVCWAANISAVFAFGLTLYFLGIPLGKALLQAIAARDMFQVIATGSALAVLLGKTSVADVTKLISIARGGGKEKP